MGNWCYNQSGICLTLQLAGRPPCVRLSSQHSAVIKRTTEMGPESMRNKNIYCRWWFVVSSIFYDHRYLGKISNLTFICFRWVGSTTSFRHLRRIKFITTFAERLRPLKWESYFWKSGESGNSPAEAKKHGSRSPDVMPVVLALAKKLMFWRFFGDLTNLPYQCYL